jgi:hypothetical protein
MPQEAPTNGPHLPWGFIGALMAIAVLLVVVEHGPRESSSATFISGAGLMPLAGVLLMLPERTWLVGVGFIVGAMASIAGVVAIAALSVVQHTF